MYFNPKDWTKDLKNESIFIFEEEEEKYLKLGLFAKIFYVYVQVKWAFFLKAAEANLYPYVLWTQI